MALFGAFWVLLGVLCIWEGAGFAGFFSSCLQDSGYGGVPIAGHPFRRRSVGVLSAWPSGKSLVCAKVCLM